MIRSFDVVEILRTNSQQIQIHIYISNYAKNSECEFANLNYIKYRDFYM